MLRPLLAASAIALLLASCAGEPRRTGPISAETLAKLEAVRLDPAEAGRILNAYRASRGLRPVRPDPTLMGMAQRQADAMAAANALSHDAGSGFNARIHAAGLDTVRAAENIGGGYYSTLEAFDGWKRSPDHDANLLMPEATRFGIALAKDPRTTYRSWWVVVLAAEPEQRREMPTAEGVWFGSNPRPR